MGAGNFDAVVVGAGAGGLCAAARLSHAGLKTLLLDDHDQVGGRATTEIIDGFKVNVGAIALEFGGVFEDTFRLVGAPLNIRAPKPATAFLIDGKLVDISRGGWSLLLGQFTKQAAKVLEKFAEARAGQLPDGRQSTEDWLKTYTGNKTVHAIFRNLCAAIFACNASELPARAFLTYFTSKGAFKKFGYCPDGTIGVWNSLADAIRRNGSEVCLSSPATQIHVDSGSVTGVSFKQNGKVVRIASSIVISNAGPTATITLAGETAFSPDYVTKARETLRPAANIVINIASQTPLMEHPGIVTFGRTRRLCNMANLTAACPDFAPAGWYQYVAYAVPKPALGDFDAEAETQAALQDLRDIFPDFDKARILSIRVMRDEWPAQRSCAGYDMPQVTGIGGLWCVGDAVKVYGNGGTQACAETAKLVCDEILAARVQPRTAAR